MKNIAILFLASAVSGQPAFAAAAAAVPAGLMNIGVAAAVKGKVHGQAPGDSVGRVLGSGKPVYLNDHITTDAAGRLQILLLDETTFTLGPNSDMVLDEFVYDPATHVGKVSAKIQEGSFRFVTGKIAQNKPSNMKVELPVGTIGIRGTIVGGHTHDRTAEVILLGPGPNNNAHERVGGITVFNRQGSVRIDSSGYGTIIREGQGPTNPVRFNRLDTDRILGGLLAKANKENNNGGGSAGQTVTATQTSGNGNASGGVNYQTTASNLVASGGNDTSNQANQSAQEPTIADGVSTWDQIINNATGTGEYDESGTVFCSGGPCGTKGENGTLSYTVMADFGSKMIGGNVGGNSSSVSLSVGGGDTLSDSATLPAQSFGTSGQAVTTWTSGGNGPSAISWNNGSGSVTTQLMNKGGVPGAQLGVSVNYSFSGAAIDNTSSPVVANRGTVQIAR